MSKELLLTTGQLTIVDDEDYDFLVNFSKYWRLNGGYVICVKNKEVVRMHRLLMNPKGDELVDHRNNNPLDNQKENLRLTNFSGNTRNAKKTSRPTTSKFKGVSFSKQSNSWKVAIDVKNIGKIHIGYFSNEEAGALAYNEYAKKYFGEFAYLNQIENNEINYKDFIIKRKNKSRYKGVTFNKSKDKWEAQIYENKKIKKLGAKNTEKDAYYLLIEYVKNSNDEDLKKRYLLSYIEE